MSDNKTFHKTDTQSGKSYNKQYNKSKNEATKIYLEKTIKINRVTKVVRGGRKFSFSVFVVVGDQKGLIGIGHGRGKEVMLAITQANEDAKKHMIRITYNKNTIPHTIIGKMGAARVLLKPATPGTGIIAGITVRSVLECLGVQDVVTKSLGSSNPINVLYATMEGLKNLLSKEEVMRNRNLDIKV